jgi:uncharacterized protein (DUF934 family)
MQIIKNKQLVDNDWRFVADDAEIPERGDITISLARWTQHAEQLVHRSDQIGVRLAPTDSCDALEGHLDGLSLIELDFPGFGDGRLFSHARLLRSRLGYSGEIRAVGQFLPDQVYFLYRVGVNAFQLQHPQQIPLALSCINDFSVNYQVSSN